MKIASSSISMSSARAYSEGIRVTSRNRISAKQTSSPSTQTKSKEQSASFEFSHMSFSEDRKYSGYSSDGRKKNYMGSSFNIERQATRAKLKMIEKEEKAKDEALKLSEGNGGVSLESIRQSLLDDVKEEEIKLIKKIAEAIRKFMQELYTGKSSQTTESKDDEIIGLSELLDKYSRGGSGSAYTGSKEGSMQISSMSVESAFEETYSYVETEAVSFSAEGSVI